MDNSPLWFQVYQTQSLHRYNELVNGLAVLNSMSRRPQEAIKPPLGVDAIVLYSNFPATKDDLFQLPQYQCILLLHAYNLNAEGTDLVQRNRLASHVGLIL